MRNCHPAYRTLATLITPLFLLGMLVSALPAFAGTTPVGIGSPVPPGPSAQSALDLDGYVSTAYVSRRLGVSGWFEMEYDIFNDNYEIFITDVSDDGPTCEIYISNQANVFSSQYSEECDATRFLRTLDVLYGNQVDVSSLLAWFEGEGVVGDPGDDNGNTPEFDPSYGKEDNDSQDCGWGDCILNAVFVAGAAVAVGATTKSAPIACAIAGIGGFAVGMKCAEGHMDDACQDKLVLQFLLLFEQAMGLDDIRRYIDVEEFIENVRTLVQSTIQVEELHELDGMLGFEVTYSGHNAAPWHDMIVALP